MFIIELGGGKIVFSLSFRRTDRQLADLQQ